LERASQTVLWPLNVQVHSSRGNDFAIVLGVEKGTFKIFDFSRVLANVNREQTELSSQIGGASSGFAGIAQAGKR